MMKDLLLATLCLSLSLMFLSSFLVHSAFADGEIEILGPKIHAGTGPKNNCENKITSCGDPGHCVDLTGMVYCVRGRVVQTKCLSNNIRNETLTSSCTGGSFRVRIRNIQGSNASANITMYNPGSSDIMGKSYINGEGDLNSLESLADMKFDFNPEFNFLIKNADIVDFAYNISDFIIDSVTTTIPSKTVFKAFYVDLPDSLTFSAITLKIKYSGISINENNITLYKCSDFDTSSKTCNTNWEVVPSIKDSVNQLVIAEVDSFSAYALGDPGNTTTTTTTTIPATTTTTTTTTIPTTTTTTASSGSSSGCSLHATNNYRCSADYVQQKYINSDCSESWLNEEHCDYGCSSGECNNPPETNTTANSDPDDTVLTSETPQNNVTDNLPDDASLSDIQGPNMLTGFVTMLSNNITAVAIAASAASAFVVGFFKTRNKASIGDGYSRPIGKSYRAGSNRYRVVRYNKRMGRYSRYSKMGKDQNIVLNL